MKYIDMYVTAKVTFQCPDDWDFDAVHEEAVRHMNTHLDLNDTCYFPKEQFNIAEVEIRQMAEESPYREP